MPVAISIAEDNRFALRSCLDKLAGAPDLKVVFKAGNGQDLIDGLASHPTDVVLMDIEMPVLNGVDATRELKKLHPQIKVIMLTTFDDDERIFQAIMAGASGYLLKEETAEVLIDAIHDSLNGGAAMSASIALKVLGIVRRSNAPQPAPVEDFGLTGREMELLEHLKAGLTYERIASNLYISVGTVRKHIENIYRKLRVSNKVEAVQKAFGSRS
jgi:DNA-binding NarL/FixJ family response regulator